MKRLDLEQTTENWKKWRSEGLGGSDIHTVIAGTDLERRSLMKRSMHPGGDRHIPEHIQVAMARGLALEPFARKLAEQALACNLPPVCIESDVDSRFRASLDGLDASGKIVLEVKCLARDTHMRIYKRYQQTGSGEASIPANYYSQIQYQLMVSEAQVAYYAGYNPEADVTFYLIPIYPNYTYHAALRDTAIGYFNTLDKNRGMPDIIGITGYARSGKDTIAEWLSTRYGYNRFSIADLPKRMVSEADGMPYPLPESEKEQWRQVLIDTSARLKEEKGQDYWIQQLIPSLEVPAVISDVRYVNEAVVLSEFARKRGLTFSLWAAIRVTEPPNETEALSIPPTVERADVIIENTGSLEDLNRILEQKVILYGV